MGQQSQTRLSDCTAHSYSYGTHSQVAVLDKESSHFANTYERYGGEKRLMVRQRSKVEPTQ